VTTLDLPYANVRPLLHDVSRGNMCVCSFVWHRESRVPHAIWFLAVGYGGSLCLSDRSAAN